MSNVAVATLPGNPYVTCPHFDIPFRFVPKNGAAVVEQDTFNDVANCVEVICRTPFGFRLDNPDFGFPNLELMKQPILNDEVIQTVQNQEPRATLLMSEQPDLIDAMIDRITVSIRSAQSS